MKKILFLISIILILLSIFLYQGVYSPKNPTSKNEVFFTIEKGQNLYQIAENLEKENLIKNKIFFDFYIFIKGDSKKLQAGTYLLNSSMNIPEVAKKMISGDTAKIRVTIPEGFTVKQIEEKLNLKLPGENLEGFLFPDTYYFPIEISGEETVRIMKENFNEKIASLKEEIEKQRKTILEIVTMASLVEKEFYNTPECPDGN